MQGYENANGYIIIAGVIVMLVMAICIVIFVLVYNKRFIEEQNRHQRILLDASIQSQENERKRLAQELHDGIGPMLATAKLQLYQLQKDRNNPEVLENFKNLLSQLIQEVRTISRGMSPSVVSKLGLIDALKSFCDTINDTTHITVDFFDRVDRTFDNSIALPLYRIGQELINNAIKHGSPSHISVKLYTVSDFLFLEVEDNGKGFTLKNGSVPESGGIGLLNIQSRLNLLNGKMDQKSSPGCCIVVCLPINSLLQHEDYHR